MMALRYLSRIVVGIVFIFSGFVKAVDPLGSAYKFQDYFFAFNLDFLNFLSLPLGILLFTIEFLAGFSVLTGIRQKAGIWVVLILMILFTPLTLVLAITNPVSDCGCFGDAIHLTNWQTFGKNVILLFFVIILFSGRKQIQSGLSQVKEWKILAGTSLLLILFSVYNLIFLPVIDFMPYKTGTNIPENMIIPEGKPSDEYYTTFIYEKDGVQKEFTLEDYPADDTTWIFVDQRSRLVSKGYQPPIHDFSIITVNAEDLTKEILSDTGYSVLMIARKLSDADSARLNKGFELGHSLEGSSTSFYVLTSSGSVEVQQINNSLQFGLMDETTLKTMLRANIGYILLKNGTIAGKWSWANVPDNDFFINL